MVRLALEFGSIEVGIQASVDSWMRREGEGDKQSGRMGVGSLVSPRTTILRDKGGDSRMT